MALTVSPRQVYSMACKRENAYVDAFLENQVSMILGMTALSGNTHLTPLFNLFVK